MERLEAARRALRERRWAEAHALLGEADAAGALGAADLELLSDTARWAGVFEGVVPPLERAFTAYHTAGDARSAARVALALCLASADAAQPTVVAGWLACAAELLDGLDEGAEHARLEWLRGRAHADRGALDAHEAAARRAYAVARRVGSRADEALSITDLGHVAAARGRTDEAVGRMGQALALAVTGEIPVLEAGMVYCQAVASFRSQGEWSRAGEWTETIDRWIEREQVDYFPGLCRIHRSEVTRHRGSLATAEAEALEAVRLLSASSPRWLGLAQAELGEVRRRRGDHAGALAAFRAALERGWDPQPGLALLILEQGDPVGAHRSMLRVLRGPTPTWIAEDRTGLTSARVETAIAAGDLDDAARALAEMGDGAALERSAWCRAAIHTAAGRLALARGDTAAAIGDLRAARRILADDDAPFELATTAELLGRALAAEGDPTTARLELEAARAVFERIGARSAAERVDRLLAAGDESNEALPLRVVTDPVPPASGSARFVLEGDVWTLALDAAEVRLRDGRGPRYIAELLAAPGDEVLALDLVARVAGTPAGSAPPDDAGAVLDARARREVEARVHALRDAIAEAEARGDADAAEAARAELEALARELARAVGLGGRGRRLGSSQERARQSVTKAIRATIRRVTELDAGLGRLLDTSIRTGTFCSYSPDPRLVLTWQLSGDAAPAPGTVTRSFTP